MIKITCTDTVTKTCTDTVTKTCTDTVTKMNSTIAGPVNACS